MYVLSKKKGMKSMPSFRLRALVYLLRLGGRGSLPTHRKTLDRNYENALSPLPPLWFVFVCLFFPTVVVMVCGLIFCSNIDIHKLIIHISIYGWITTLVGP